jgi:autotransporter-associated beta strand protein
MARLLQLAAAFGAALLPSAAVRATAVPLALEMAVSTPIESSPDGELLLLFLPGLQGFEIVNTTTGERDLVSPTPCTGYFATISPDKKYVCFKEFPQVAGARLQRPMLYNIAQKKLVALCDPASAVGNPVVSSRGQVAYTVGAQLFILNADLSAFLQIDLGAVANVLAFSPDGGRLAFSDPDEQISWIELDPGKRVAVPAVSVHGYQPHFSPKGQSLLARSANGEVTACRLSDGLARSFGRSLSPAWLDEDTVAMVRKEVAGLAVTETQVLTARLSDGALSILLAKAGDAAVALGCTVIAIGAEDGISLADTQTGLVRQSAIQSRSAPPAPKTETAPAAAMVTPQIVVTNGTTVQLLGVPYVNQVYDTDPSFPGGGSCCNATATIMAIQYYNRLPPHPITCTQGGTHTSYYGFYITSKYSYNGRVFDTASSAAWGTDLQGYYGGFGCFLQDDPGTSPQRSTRLKEWITYHGLTSATDDYVSGTNGTSNGFAKARAEIDANHPVVVLNELTSAGHYITCIGYIQNQYSLIFNDPYGNKNISYPGKQGAGAIYDWPGCNNGYQNLNGVDRYVYARGTVAANTNWGSYWDLSGVTAGAGAAPSGTWDSTSTNWSSSVNGTAATGPWAEQNAIFSAGTDATGAYTVSVSGTQMVANVVVQQGAVTFTGGRLYYLGTGTYYSNYVAAGCTAIFNTPFGGTAAPDKWGPGTAVYNGASTCGGYFSLNEGTLALGNNAALSTVRLDVGDTTGVKVVTVQSADSTARTLPNYLRLLAVNLNIGPGGNLTFTGPINVNANSNPARVIAVSNSVTTFSGVLTNTGGLTKTGPGTLVLSGTSANAYGSTSANGNTTVSGGTLKLAKSPGVAAVSSGSLIVNPGGILLLGAVSQIGNLVPMTLAGGTFQTAGFSEQLGTLSITASSQIDLGASASVLIFAASSGVSWTAAKTLTITNWNGSITGGGAGRLIFGGSGSGLSAGQVSQIRFANPPGFPAGSYAATILSTGEVVPLPVAPTLCGAGCSSNGQFQLSLVGVPGYQYAILTSSNLIDWCVLQTNSSPSTFTDTNTSGPPCRFYRAQYLP